MQYNPFQMTNFEEQFTPTIFDVAREAGVARATVDRVIYKRGGVAESTIKKVNEVIQRLGYTPNPNASRLASKKKLTIACLIPQFEAGEYWSVAYKGFMDGAKSIKTYDVTTDIHLFNPDDIDSFRKECEDIIQSRPAGVITNVVFADEVSKFAENLEKNGVPYAFVDQKIDGLDYTVYFGADPHEAGYLGAFLLTHRTEVKDVAMVRLLRDKNRMADPNRVRREGFISYLEENCPGCRVHTVFIPPHDAEKTYEILDKFFKEHPKIHHITMANSRIHLISDYLRRNPSPDRHVVGFDDLEKNIEALNEGLVEYLVTRNIPMQSFYTISSLASAIISGKRPEERDNYMHMDILHRLNSKHYLFRG